MLYIIKNINYLELFRVVHVCHVRRAPGSLLAEGVPSSPQGQRVVEHSGSCEGVQLAEAGWLSFPQHKRTGSPAIGMIQGRPLYSWIS